MAFDKDLPFHFMIATGIVEYSRSNAKRQSRTFVLIAKYITEALSAFINAYGF
jgi:hypothetical protein